MKKLVLLIKVNIKFWTTKLNWIALLTFIIFGTGMLFNNNISLTACNEKSEIEETVIRFGSRLKNVPLLISKNVLRKSMVNNYGDFVTDELIEKWVNDPKNAPGRLTSSPWPDRIEINSIKKLSGNNYEINGDIIEITSMELTGGGYAAKRPITLLLKIKKGKWIIYDAGMGSYRKIDSVIYENKKYGFNIILPESWQDYKVITGKWEGVSSKTSENGKITASGTLIYIRHPKWTVENKRQDIPIMIFTVTEWNQLEKGDFHIGAAPVGPRELGRNSFYVFALPARYNFNFYKGYKEVEDIINSNSLEPIEIEKAG